LLRQLASLQYLMYTGPRNGRIDLAACAERGLPVSYTEIGTSKTSTAELTWALVMGASKRLLEQTRLVGSGGWRDQTSVLPVLRGERLGLVGLGAIGSQVAKYGHAFGMEVVAWSPNMTAERAAKEGARFLPLNELLSTSKVVSIHLVEAPSTRGLLDRARLSLMRPDSLLVNTSRSTLVVTNDLAACLALGRPGQAALDVHDVEPLPEDWPLKSQPRALLTPHLGFVAEPVIAKFSEGIIENLTAWLDGRPLLRVVTAAADEKRDGTEKLEQKTAPPNLQSAAASALPAGGDASSPIATVVISHDSSEKELFKASEAAAQ